MINFRYHVVSITAVFLALAIGLVVGTAALNGPVADSLSASVNELRKDNDQLRETVGSLQEEVTREEDFARESAPLLLGGKLAGHRVLVLCLPSGEKHVDGVIEMLRQTGATLTGRIDIQDKFVKPDNSVDLLGLAEQAARPSVSANGLPGNSNGVETSSAFLASALLDRPDATVVTEQDRRSVLDAYSNAGYLTVSDKVTGPAEAVVVVSGQPYVDRDSAQKDQAVVTMTEQFDKAVPLVVAGSGTSTGNVVQAVRDDPALSKTISTVDHANTVQGQVVTALALIEQVIDKKAGQYGLGAGATLLPKQPE
ncbi:copper transport outer membrane protein MctB [Micromonospora pisi]|uniref:Copper transport outer membrane protein MctB n=1 Tax=Micromonospora pisi TaxID=589240 RepID=A0A495JS07_9ACTN|nr:copper transporter [Micromonospora pisi]RKR91753.1 copper transport outer membrane protein MctB [Micromonospora pisi]